MPSIEVRGSDLDNRGVIGGVGVGGALGCGGEAVGGGTVCGDGDKGSWGEGGEGSCGGAVVVVAGCGDDEGELVLAWGAVVVSEGVGVEGVACLSVTMR